MIVDREGNIVVTQQYVYGNSLKMETCGWYFPPLIVKLILLVCSRSFISYGREGGRVCMWLFPPGGSGCFFM